MSSIVNKSGVRFQPKVKQRRSVSLTPKPSRTSSVAPVDEQVVEDEEDDDDEEEDDEEDDEVLADDLMPTPADTQRRSSIVGSVPTSRRASIVELTATKQRRLSTLSNTSRPGDIFRRTSFSGTQPSVQPAESRSHVISIPQPPTLKKRRRSSAALGPRSSLLKRKSLSEDAPSTTLITPPATQIATPMAKADAKSQEDMIGEPIIEENESEEQEEQEQEKEQEKEDQEDVKPIVTSGSSLKEAVIFDELLQVVRKVKYDASDSAMEKAFKDFTPKVTNYSQLPKALHSYDPEQLADIKIDDDKFQMAELCKPSLPIGRVSSQFQRAQEARKNRMEARKKRQLLRKQAKSERRSIESLTEDLPDEKKIKPEDLLDEDHMNEHNVHSAIQLKLGTDGTLIVDEESRIVDRHKNMDNIIRERHDENPFENIVNSATYGKQRYTDKWDKDEVSKFYQALGTWGTDFALIAQMFPYRTRRQIKSKFILEEKKRPRLIELALSNKLKTQFDFDNYCNDANKTFSTLDEFNVKLEQLKQEHEQNLKELTLAKERAKEEDVQKQKKAEHEIQTGQRTMTRQERITELSRHETVLGSIDDVKKQRQQ